MLDKFVSGFYGNNPGLKLKKEKHPQLYKVSKILVHSLVKFQIEIFLSQGTVTKRENFHPGNLSLRVSSLSLNLVGEYGPYFLL